MSSIKLLDSDIIKLITYQSTSSVQENCYLFFKIIHLNYFCYFKIYHNGKMVGLTSDQE